MRKRIAAWKIALDNNWAITTSCDCWEAGGFAEVYLAEHIHLQTQSAIKLLHTQLAQEDMEYFRNEARTLARLVHPNIVRVFDFGIENRTPYLVMDYAPNGTLRQRHPAAPSFHCPPLLVMSSR